MSRGPESSAPDIFVDVTKGVRYLHGGKDSNQIKQFSKTLSRSAVTTKTG